ncbi:MAG: hypothetical protein HY700_17385 [Gemmatimonadetes bacterium]|nr:hypothetical protein [Gemmatimonadota bacterium]
MSRRQRWQNRSGKTSTGCLFTLLVLVVVAYYGVGIGSAYLRYWRMQDAMRTQARLAPTLDDPVIRRRLVTRAEELDLPAEATRFVIRRRERPREIVITTRWQEAIDLPFYTWVITFRPEARALL